MNQACCECPPLCLCLKANLHARLVGYTLLFVVRFVFSSVSVVCMKIGLIKKCVTLPQIIYRDNFRPPTHFLCQIGQIRLDSIRAN